MLPKLRKPLSRRRYVIHVIIGLLLAIAFYLPPITIVLTDSVFNPVGAQSSPVSNQFSILAEGDRLYLEGNTDGAETLYRQVKPPFPDEGGEAISSLTIYDPEDLPPAGQVYWRNGQQGLEQSLDTLVFESLPRLVENYPEFIPGHLALADAYKTFDQPEESLAVLERAAAIYPDDPELLQAQMQALAENERYLEASITARQFAIIYPDHPQSPEFSQSAEEYSNSYRKKLNRTLLRQQITGTVLGVVRGVLTDDWSSGLTGLQTLLLLGQSESEVGAKFAAEHRQQLQLLDNPEVIGYVEELGRQIEPLMGRNDFEYEYYVVQDSSLNASAFPGGKIFVNTGAITNTQSEAELLGLMGHEIAHAALSHGYQRLANAAVLNSLQGVIPFGDLITNLVAAEYSRSNEKQADILGTRVSALSGYAADGLRNLMATLQQQSGDRAQSLLATHPAPASRVRYLEKLIQQNGYNRYAFEGVERHKRIQDLIQGIEPTDPSGSTPPSGGSQLNPEPRSAAPSLPSDPLASAGDRSDVSLTRDNVTISLAAFERQGTTVRCQVIIQNQSDRPFGFVPIFTRVVDSEETRFTSNISFETSGGDVLVQPGQSLEGSLVIFGGDRPSALNDDLFLVITEGTSGGRLFRIGF